MSGSVLAAIDLGPASERVLRHAAGFARLFGAPLRVLHVSAEPADDERRRVAECCVQLGPYEVDLGEDDIVVRSGLVSEAIHREAARQDAILVVMGTRGHNRLALALLGSTCEAVLRNTAAPVLLVPPNDLDIIDISDRPRLICGPVLAAVDLTENTDRQLKLAGELAHLASQPLLLLAVLPSRGDTNETTAMLRDRAHVTEPMKPHALIVRRGDIAEEISRCAQAEGAGLVVMGLRARGRGKPGAIASAVFRTRRAFVLAVPAS